MIKLKVKEDYAKLSVNEHAMVGGGGGINFIISWDGTDTPIPSNIPEGVVITYNGNEYIGTLSASSVRSGSFYLVKSSRQVKNNNAYDEYVPIVVDGSKVWERMGSTQIHPEDFITDVSLEKDSDFAIGADSTFSVTQPTVSLKTDVVGGDGTVSVMTGISDVEVSGGSVRIKDRDPVSAIIGYNTPTKNRVIKTLSKTKKKLETTTVTGVNGSTSASKVSAINNQTTANGSWTSSAVNTDWLKGISVVDGTLYFGAATMDTQTTAQYTFEDVSVPTPATNAVTVATGNTVSDGSGADVVTDVDADDTVMAIVSLGIPETKGAMSSSSVVEYTLPAVTVTPSTENIKAVASGANVSWNSKDQVQVLTNETNLNISRGE